MMATRILLAEDNENLKQMLQKFLAARGFEVTATGNGNTALQSIISSPPDLLILDLRLPELSGVELLQTLRRDHADILFPVIIMSGVYKGERYVEGARRMGVNHYLEKPFTPQLFLKAVQEALADHSEKRTAATLRSSIIDIYGGKKSGLLSISHHTPICFIKGEPVSFLSRGREEFAAYLVSRGRISGEDVSRFAASGSERIYFTQTGLMTYDDLTEESRRFLTTQVIDALENDAEFTFAEGSPDVELPLVPLSVPRLCYDATKNRTALVNPPAFMSRFGPLYPSRTARYFRLINLTTMREEDIELLERVDGSTPLSEIVPGDGRQREAVAFFNYLLSLGMMDFNQAPSAEASPEFYQKQIFNRPLEESHQIENKSVGFEDLVEDIAGSVVLVPYENMGAPLSTDEIGFEQSVLRDHAFLKGKNYYELFDLTSNTFSFNALKEAYFSRTRLYSPERFMELSGTTQSVAQEILSIYSSAYNTLSNVIAKERYDELLNADTVGLDGKQDEKLQAKIQFQSGNVFLEMEEFENAEKALQDAYTLEPENALHCAYLAWAIYKNPANRDSRAAQEKARNLLGRALSIEKCPEAFTFRGWMLLDEGRDGLAEGEFQKALKLNPRDSSARKGLRQITEKRDSEKKGLFRKLFG